MKKINCILLVDDSSDDNGLHKIKIKKAHICNQIQIVTSGQEALDYLIKSGEPGLSESFPKPDVIYLDVNMPGMSGLDFLEHYKELEPKLKSKIVIIMLTTSLSTHDRERAMATKEVTEFQNKPLNVDTLHDTVKKYF